MSRGEPYISTTEWTNPKTGASIRREQKCIFYRSSHWEDPDDYEIDDTEEAPIYYNDRLITTEWPSAYEKLDELLEKHGKQTDKPYERD